MSKKTILITGCSSGIGLDAALTLKALNYRVFATVRKERDVERLRDLGLEVFKLDLADFDSIDQALDCIFDLSNHRLDFLFNNGAYGQPGALEDLPTEALIEQFHTNVFGWHYLTKKIIKVMRRQGHGRIIQNSSVLGFVCMPYRGAYNASKYAIEALTDTWRLELANTNIHLCLIEPGPIKTAFRANAYQAFLKWIEPEESEHIIRYQKEAERLQNPEATAAFTLPPAAVTRALIHCIEARRPKLRYRVTFPTHLFSVLKRLLPARWLDKLLNSA